MFSLMSLILLSVYGSTALQSRQSDTGISLISPSTLTAFNAGCSGRLALGVPLAEPCYSNYDGNPVTPSPSECNTVQAGYDNSIFIAQNFGGYQNVNWGMCQTTGQRCVLNFSAPATPISTSSECYQGSVPYAYFAPGNVSDVQKALSSAKSSGVTLVIKNSGHDYKGRSSAPNSLALWMYPYQKPITLVNDFTPEGCSTPVGSGVTVTAGQPWIGVYEFAEANNITVVGGSSKSVGAAGGWLTGGGHSLLSNTHGLGVDNALQIRAVLPNGTYMTANRCQNQDIFFALRGGGGNAFGVNMEVTYRAYPRVVLQVANFIFVASSITSFNAFFPILTQNANKWAEEGWGGYINLGPQARIVISVLLASPNLSHEDALTSMAPLFAFANSSNTATIISANVTTSNSFYQAYQEFILPNEEAAGIGAAIASRLIPKSLLSSADGQNSLSNALVTISNMTIYPTSPFQKDPLSPTYGAPVQILATTPYSYTAFPGESLQDSSVTPAWRTSTWHVVVGELLSNEADAETITSAFTNVHDAVNLLRDLTPDSGAYQNEADIFEPNASDSFWGNDNYQRLQSIKKEVDPDNIMTCWGCIGWDKTDARYSCYPDVSSI